MATRRHVIKVAKQEGFGWIAWCSKCKWFSTRMETELEADERGKEHLLAMVIE